MALDSPVTPAILDLVAGALAVPDAALPVHRDKDKKKNTGGRDRRRYRRHSQFRQNLPGNNT